MSNSAIIDWVHKLPFQMQTTLYQVLRGPDGLRKNHPVKGIQRAFRACVVKAAAYGRAIELDDLDDSFISLKPMTDLTTWNQEIFNFLNCIDQLPTHYLTHMMHAASIIGYYHPNQHYRNFWNHFYVQICKEMRVNPETKEQLTERLSDFGRELMFVKPSNVKAEVYWMIANNLPEAKLQQFIHGPTTNQSELLDKLVFGNVLVSKDPRGNVISAHEVNTGKMTEVIL